MSDDLRDLLTRVASGELDPAEASRLLDATTPDEHGGAAAGRVSVTTPGREAALTTVEVVASGVRLHLFADPSIATAVVEGPHSIRQEGDRLVVDLPAREGKPGWQIGRFRVDSIGSGERVSMRVNPDLAVRLSLAACDANVRGLRAPLDCSATSCSLSIADHRGPLTGIVSASSAKVEAVLTGSSDAITCDMGSLKLALLPGSDTTVITTTEMASVKIAGGRTRSDVTDVPGTLPRAVAGEGHGRLTVAARMSTVKVQLP